MDPGDGACGESLWSPDEEVAVLIDSQALHLDQLVSEVL